MKSRAKQSNHQEIEYTFKGSDDNLNNAFDTLFDAISNETFKQKNNEHNKINSNVSESFYLKSGGTTNYKDADSNVERILN